MDDAQPDPPSSRRLLGRRDVVVGGTLAAVSTLLAVAATPGAAGAVKGKRIGPARDVPVGGSASFTDPNTGQPSLVIQLRRGKFVAYDAVCPHEGCTVGYVASAKLIMCPCHGSEFNASNGSRIRGPAPHGLKRLTVTDTGGELFVAG